MVSARMDDEANYLPARLSWLLLGIAAGLCRLKWLAGAAHGWRDRYVTANSTKLRLVGSVCGRRLRYPASVAQITTSSLYVWTSPGSATRAARYFRGRYFPNDSIDVGSLQPPRALALFIAARCGLPGVA